MGAVIGEWVGKSTEQLKAAAAADSEEETVTAVPHTVCPGAPRGGEQCITIRYENWLDRRDLVDSYSGPNKQAESAITTAEGRIVLQRATGYPVEWREDLTTTIEVRRLDDGQKYAIEGQVRRVYTFELVEGSNGRAR